MAWVRIDDCFDEHPKLQKVGPIGWGYWLAGLAYCNRNLTDGFIPWAKSQTLASFVVMEHDQKLSKLCHSSGMSGDDMDANWVIGLLLNAGLWEDVDGGYLVHDYADYQPTREQVEAEREITRKRVEAHRNKKNGQFGNGNVTPLHDSYSSVSNTVVTPAPNPNPNPIERDKSLSKKNARASSLPDEWMPDERTQELVMAEGFTDGHMAAELPKFRDHWIGKGEVRKDWNATFRNWMRNAKSWGNIKTIHVAGQPDTLDDGTPCKPGLVRHSVHNTCCDPSMRDWVG